MTDASPSAVESAAEVARARARQVQTHYAPAEPRALGTMAILAVLTILWMVVPVGIGILLGGLLAFAAYSLYASLARRTGKPTLAALGLSAGATLLVTGTVGTFGYALVRQGVSFVGALPDAFAPGRPAAVVTQRILAPLGLVKLQPMAPVDRLRDAIGGVATSLAGWAAQVVGTVFDGVLAVFFMAATMFYVLRRWRSMARRVAHLAPFNPHHTRRLLGELRRLGRVVLVGNFGTAIVQGLVAGAGYAVARLPHAAFLSATTAVASLIPAFGTLLVWVPAGVVMIAGGRVAAGTFVLAWGALAIVGFCDYVVRPRLVGGRDTMSLWTTYVALFGGLKVFGAVGLLLGPLLVGLAISILNLYERTRRFRLGLC